MVLFCPISKKKYSWQSVQCLLLGRSVCVTSNHILGFLFVLLPSTCWYFPPGTRGSELSSHTLSLPLPSHNLSVKSKFPFFKDMGGVGGGRGVSSGLGTPASPSSSYRKSDYHNRILHRKLTISSPCWRLHYYLMMFL